MISFKQFLAEILQERAPAPVIKLADVLLAYVQKQFPVEEIESYRGARYDATGFYQIRLKPAEGQTVDPDMMDQLYKAMISPKGQKFGFENVKNDANTGNSGKFSGITFSYGGGDYEFILGFGANKGEKFEKDLLKAMQDYIDGEYNELGEKAFAALEEVNPDLAPENVEEVKKRSGSTKRTIDTKLEDVGEIIGDIIVKTKDQQEHYISVKNIDGQVLANVGLSKAMSKDLKIDVKSPDFKEYMLPFGLDPKRIEDGFKAHQTQVPIKGSATDEVDKPVKPGSKLMDILKRMWGANYIYLREKGGDLTAMEITEDFLDNELLAGVKIVKITYPSEKAKQVTIILQNQKATYRIEYRSSKGGYTPLEVKCRITKFNA